MGFDAFSEQPLEHSLQDSLTHKQPLTDKAFIFFRNFIVNDISFHITNKIVHVIIVNVPHNLNLKEKEKMKEN